MSSAFDPTEDGGARPPGKIPYERLRRDPAKVPVELPTYEPAKWKAVRMGLTIIFWAWAGVLALGVSFLVLWIANNFLKKLDTSFMQSVGIGAAYAALVCLAAVFVGYCFCTLVPALARARIWAI